MAARPLGFFKLLDGAPMTMAMSFETALARISYLHAALQPPAARAPTTTPGTGGATFAGALQGASAVATTAAAPGASGVAAIARGELELGVAEEPPGSNDGARIRHYRSAVGNAPPGPWCAYFASWVARQAGTPLGESGQGFGSVDAVWAWAQRAGRAVPAAGVPSAATGVPALAGPSGAVAGPRPGDLIVWDEHIGVVEAVLADGRVQTIEGNSSDRVSRRVHPPGSAIGYVRLG